MAPSQRPAALAAGGPQPAGVGGHADEVDYGSTSRAGVLADAEPVLCLYGVGESAPGQDLRHMAVELSFTSSVRFLQPGLCQPVRGGGGELSFLSSIRFLLPGWH